MCLGLLPCPDVHVWWFLHCLSANACKAQQHWHAIAACQGSGFSLILLYEVCHTVPRCAIAMPRCTVLRHAVCCVLLQELLHAARVVLPHLVRLLPAAVALASTSAETLDFITKHTHHPHYPPFRSTGSSGRSSGSSSSSKGGWGKGDTAALEAAGEQGFLLEVPRVVAQLMGERWVHSSHVATRLSQYGGRQLHVIEQMCRGTWVFALLHPPPLTPTLVLLTCPAHTYCSHVLLTCTAHMYC